MSQRTPRLHAPILLAEQLVAWVLHRQHATTLQIAHRIGRTERQARAVLFGGEV